MIERLAAYVAEDRLLALAQGRDLPDRALGAALSADLAGFTSLSDALVRQLGPRSGVEELTRQLNAVYDGLIAAVEAHGGAVVGFAGDGFTAWFDEQRGAPAARAAGAGVAMQQAFRDWIAAAAGREALGLRVAVASGPVRRFAVGAPELHRLDVLAGRTMLRLAAADAVAGRGEVVLDAATVEALGTALQASEVRSDAEGRPITVVGRLEAGGSAEPWPDCRERLSLELLRPWLLPPVVERLQAGRAELLAELRPAAALFLGFAGIAYDEDSAAGEQLDSFVRRVQAILERYEGSLLQLTIGDKGSYLYAAFGAPLAHEDDAFRAVRAAVRLSRSAGLEPVGSLRVGVSHGLARTGAYGSARRRTYGVLGGEVNLAARLMQKAPAGTPLFSDRVRMATRDSVRWEPLQPVTVKGRSDPVPVFHAAEALRARKPDVPLCGRDDERTVLGWSIELAAAGEGGAVLLEGEAGSGKSRLVEDALAHAEPAGLRVLAGAGDPIERQQPYHAWRGVFDDLLELQGRERARAAHSGGHTIGPSRTRLRGPAASTLGPREAERLRARVEQALPGSSALAPLLNAVLARKLPETERTAALVPLVRGARTVEVLVSLLRHAAQQQPLVVVLEDAQWLDSGSWALALRAAELPGVLLLLALRPLGAGGPSELTLLKLLPATRVVPVGPLAPESILAVAAAVLGASRLAPDVAALVSSRAEGAPLVAIELARSLRETGLVTVIDGEARRVASPVAGTAPVSLPDTLEGVVRARVDRLPPSSQSALKVAAVIGRSFAWGALRRLVVEAEGAGADAELPAAVERLAVAGLVEVLPAESEPAWAFRSALVHQVVYELMDSDQRLALHRAVAEWLEGAWAELQPADLAVLAHHWTSAGRRDRAEPYLERAADAALRAGAWAEAARLFSALLDAETERSGQGASMPFRSARRSGWLQKLGMAEAGTGRHADARLRFEQALELLGQPTGVALVPAALGAGARDLVRRVAPALLPGRDDPALAQAVVSYERLSEIHWLSGAPRPALREALRGLELALRTGQEPVRARLQGSLALAAGTAGFRKLGELLMRDAVAAARRTGDPEALAWVLELHGLQSFASGRWAAVRDALEEALAVREAAADRRRALELRVLLALARLTRGEARAAGGLFEAIDVDASAEADEPARAAAAMGLAIAALRLGEPARCLSLVDGRRATALRPLAHALLGEPYEALAALPAALEQARRRPLKCWLLERHALPAEAALYLREVATGLPAVERARLAVQLEDAVAAAARFARVFPVGAARAALCRGTAEWLSGRPGRARAAWTEALRAARRLDLPFDEARAALRLGRHVARDGGERRELLSRAGALFAELGAADEQREAEAALARS